MATDKRQITRNRVSLSCRTCRRRKVKCDKVHPICTGCQKSGEDCVYGSIETLSLSDHAQTKHDSGYQDTRKRRAVDIEDSTDNDESHSKFPTIKTLQQKLNTLHELVNDINRLTPLAISNDYPHDPHSRNSTAIHFDQGTGQDTEATGHASIRSSQQNSNQLEGSGSAHVQWTNLLSQLEKLNKLLRSRARSELSHSTSKAQEASIPVCEVPSSSTSNSGHDHATSTPISISPDCSPTLTSDKEEMMAPTEEESDALFRVWLFSVYPVFPILSPRRVLERYKSFNLWYKYGMDKGQPNPDPSFMPFLTFIWYSGYVNMSRRAKDKWFPWMRQKPAWARTLRNRLESQLEIMKMDATPSVFTLAASIISQYMGIGCPDIMSKILRNTMNIRAAQNLGLHSEKTVRGMSPSTAETRRRLWWEAISLDASLSTVSGMPVMIDEIYSDTTMISELKESCVGTKDAQEYEKQIQGSVALPDRPDDPANCCTSSLVSVHFLVARARYNLTTATKKLLKGNMRAQPMTMEELTNMKTSMLKAGQQVQEVINRIPTRGIPEFDLMPETRAAAAEFDCVDELGSSMTEREIDCFLHETSNSDNIGGTATWHRPATIAFHKWARITLSMMIDRLECISYAPFLKNSKSRLWGVARNCALKSCHGFMRKFLCLAKDPELRCFRWAWSSMFHPMHATIIMLIDCHDRPHSDEAPRSRAMIDEMFSLSSPSNGTDCMTTAATPLKEGGQEAWTMLRKLRHKAWQKAGLDPDVLWSEEDQVSVGVCKPLNENDLFIQSLREDIILSYKRRRDRNGGARPPRLNSRDIVRALAGEDLRVQHRHPFEVGPGEQVSGPLTRNLADFDDGLNIPAILLLRARHDQEAMPYPLDGNLQSASHSDHEISSVKPSEEEFTRTTDAPKMIHIGELIKKIKGSRTQNVTSGSTMNEFQTDDLRPQGQPHQRNCDFRTIREVETAAYEDLLDKHSTPAMLPTSNETIPPKHTNLQNAPRFWYFPTSPAPSFDLSAINNHTSDRTTTLQEQSLTNPQSSESLSLAASIPPTLHNRAFNRARPPMAASNNHTTAHEPQSHNDSSAVQSIAPTDLANGLTDTDAATGMNLEVDFDWDRWDELFGQFAGFEDMLVDESRQEQLNVEIHAMAM